MKRLRGGLVCKPHRLVAHSSLGWRVIQKKRRQGVRHDLEVKAVVVDRFIIRFRRVLTPEQTYFTESDCKVVLQKSIPAQIRQLVLYISNDKRYVDVCVQRLTFADYFINTFCEIKTFYETVKILRPSTAPILAQNYKLANSQT